ncbi:MAG: tetratricopeptide repeat protein [Rhizobiales bacterium]|nr:tetratricopeptide repeat protein [Hyphomicrobiales bacterium]
MTFRSRCRTVAGRWPTGAITLAVLFLSGPMGLHDLASAEETVAAPKAAAEAPSYQNRSLFGSYLAGRFARSQREMDSAARFFREALERDPDDKDMVQNAFLSEAAIGSWDEAARRAEQVVKDDPTNRLAQIFLGTRAFKERRFEAAEEHLSRAAVGPIGELTSTLARAWIRFADGKVDEALTLVDGLRQDWARFYRDNHKALILDAAGRHDEAQTVWASLFKDEPRTLRVALGHARHAMAIGEGDAARAKRVLLRHMRATGRRDPLASELYREIAAGGRPGLLVADAEHGMAELLFGLGEALTTEGGIDVGTIYLQLATYVRGDFEAAFYALGNVHEATKHYDKAIGAYRGLDKTSPLGFEAGLRIAYNLNWLEKEEESRAQLSGMLDGVMAQIAAHGGNGVRERVAVKLSERGRFAQESLAALGYYDGTSDGRIAGASLEALKAFQKDSGLEVDGIVGPRTILSLQAALDHELATELDDRESRVLLAIGNLLRGHEKYGEAIGYYARAIEKIDEPLPEHWNYYYSRGVCYERVKQWPKAEADLRQALALNPDQPLILNYLGYSWVDQNLNLEEAMELIRKAVRLKPDDGYFVDSLGWAYYRLGKFDSAVRYLERAVELRPEDPVINDHLGDALWRVGRTLEARFQWGQALDLKPEPEEVDKIKAKIVAGLPEVGKDQVVGSEAGANSTEGAAAGGSTQ